MKNAKTQLLKSLLYIILIITPTFTPAKIHAQNQNSRDLYTLTLENGFTVFVKDDPSSALIHATFVSRAGFNSQTPQDAGFYPLYARLFLTTAQDSHPDFFAANSIQASCNADSTTFTADITWNSLDEFMEIIAQCAKNPVFTDQNLNYYYRQMKEEVQEYGSTTTGFINSSIDSRVFWESPWKHDSGVYPALFSGKTLGEVRSVLTEIGRRKYIPQNTALFISGNVNRQEVYQAAAKYFLEWPVYYPFQGIEQEEAPLPVESPAHKKYVLSDSAFTPQLTQVVVQYTELSMSQADILNASFNSIVSPYKTRQLNDPLVAIRSKDYLACGTSHQTSSSRLIMQALMEAPYSFSMKAGPQTAATPLDQVEAFISNIKLSAILSPAEFQKAQKEINSRYRAQTGSSAAAMDMIAAWWAMDPDYSSKGFYSRYLAFVESSQNVSHSQLVTEILKQEPYVFVLLNDQVYQANAQAFEQAGYELITRENASWYNDQMLAQIALENPQQETQNQQRINFSDRSLFTRAENYYYSNSINIYGTTLDNGIPLYVKQQAGSENVTISLCLQGGELESPADQHYLRTVLTNYFAVNIQNEITKLKVDSSINGQTEIKSRTEETASWITINCSREDAGEIMNAAFSAVIFGDIIPSVADRLVYEQKNLWQTKTADLGYQLECRAMESIYNNSEFKKLWNLDDPILENTTYNSLSLAYTQLLDASIYSIVVCGDASLEEAQEWCSSTLGLLKEQGARKNFTTAVPSLPNKIQRFQLRHIYTTDRPAEEASPESPLLIPTTDFEDPVQFYMLSPQETQYMDLFNALLMELQYRIQMELGSLGECTIQKATPAIPLAAVRVETILHTAKFLRAYQNACTSLASDLEEGNQGILKRIKDRWEVEFLANTSTNEGTAMLIQQGILAGHPSRYLDSFLFVDTADFGSALFIMNNYIPENPLYKAYSIDAQN